MTLINNADAAPSAAETHQSGTRWSSDIAESMLARIQLDDGRTIQRWFLEQSFRNGKEDGCIAARVAVYLNTSQSEDVPGHLMERFRAEARVLREEPLSPEDEAFLDGMGYGSRPESF